LWTNQHDGLVRMPRPATETIGAQRLISGPLYLQRRQKVEIVSTSLGVSDAGGCSAGEGGTVPGLPDVGES
jgi:hypothetical protein